MGRHRSQYEEPAARRSHDGRRRPVHGISVGNCSGEVRRSRQQLESTAAELAVRQRMDQLPMPWRAQVREVQVVTMRFTEPTPTSRSS